MIHVNKIELMFVIQYFSMKIFWIPVKKCRYLDFLTFSIHIPLKVI